MTVREVMMRRPKVCDPTTTVAQARAFFDDDHLHALLIVADGRLTSVVERGDLTGACGDGPVAPCGRLAGRLVDPGADADRTRKRMVRAGLRRLAVADSAGALLGLLCLKRSGTGFCSDADAWSRESERECRDEVPAR